MTLEEKVAELEARIAVLEEAHKPIEHSTGENPLKPRCMLPPDDPRHGRGRRPR